MLSGIEVYIEVKVMVVNYDTRKIVVDNNVGCIDAIREHYDYFSHDKDTPNIIKFRDWVVCLKVYDLYPEGYENYFSEILKNTPHEISVNGKSIIDLLTLSIDMACNQSCDFVVETVEFEKLNRRNNIYQN